MLFHALHPADSQSTSFTKLSDTVGDLMDASLAESTKSQYTKDWKEFNFFCMKQLSESDANMTVSINTLSLYLASLFHEGYAPSTLSTYNSDIGFRQKIICQIRPLHFLL